MKLSIHILKKNRKGIVESIKFKNKIIISYPNSKNKYYQNTISFDIIIINLSNKPKEWKYFLFNILTGETYQIFCTIEKS